MDSKKKNILQVISLAIGVAVLAFGLYLSGFNLGGGLSANIFSKKEEKHQRKTLADVKSGEVNFSDPGEDKIALEIKGLDSFINEMNPNFYSEEIDLGDTSIIVEEELKKMEVEDQADQIKKESQPEDESYKKEEKTKDAPVPTEQRREEKKNERTKEKVDTREKASDSGQIESLGSDKTENQESSTKDVPDEEDSVKEEVPAPSAEGEVQ